jgi:hypothetical protein
MSFKLTPLLATKIILWILFWALLVMLSLPVMAQSSSDTRISRSISFSSSDEIDKATKDVQLKQADADIMEALVKEGFRTESLTTGISIENINYNHVGDIIIYDASTMLISDFNADGYYHRFSVTIDADTIYDVSYVYAKLYLSYEGGPWNHYASSEAYHIYGDSERDTFTIETELADGFSPGYYDIRIELYNADSDDWLLNYGPYEDASLSALPLEDAYYDDYHDVAYPVETEVIVAGHGHGALSWWLLMVPALLMITRQLSGRAGKTITS